MSLRDLPKSLIDSVSEIVSESTKRNDALRRKVLAEGLKHFGVSSISELSEADQRALNSWAQLRLTEADCSCGEDLPVNEDDMPGDSVFHKGGDEDAEKKKEIDEEDSEEVSEEDKIDVEDLKENVAVDVDELSFNGAVGVTDADSQPPVHVDVLRDSNPVDGTHEYRLFVQFNTNALPQIVPPASLPGAPTIEALRDVVEGLPFYGEAVEAALAAALDLPHTLPQFRGANNDEAAE